jgi:hypothetical protein
LSGIPGSARDRERAAATTVPTERDLLIKLTARDIGTPARDVHVVNTLYPRHLNYRDMLVVRGPRAFPH